MSRHHILPPIEYRPAPPKPKKTTRRGAIRAKRAADGSEGPEETGEVADTAPASHSSVLPQSMTRGKTAEQRIPSTTGKLSDGTLKAMLEVQEHGTQD